jgi:hypothetical protein
MVAALVGALRPGGADLGTSLEASWRDGIADAKGGESGPFPTLRLLALRLVGRLSCIGPSGSAMSSPEDAVRRGPTASLWLIWPEGGCASIA